MSYKARVLAREPRARLTREDLAHNGTYHWSVRVGEERRWLSTPGMHSCPLEAWRGAWYSLEQDRVRRERGGR